MGGTISVEVWRRDGAYPRRKKSSTVSLLMAVRLSDGGVWAGSLIWRSLMRSPFSLKSDKDESSSE